MLSISSPIPNSFVIKYDQTILAVTNSKELSTSVVGTIEECLPANPTIVDAERFALDLVVSMIEQGKPFVPTSVIESAPYISLDVYTSTGSVLVGWYESELVSVKVSVELLQSVSKIQGLAPLQFDQELNQITFVPADEAEATELPNNLIGTTVRVVSVIPSRIFKAVVEQDLNGLFVVNPVSKQRRSVTVDHGMVWVCDKELPGMSDYAVALEPVSV